MPREQSPSRTVKRIVFWKITGDETPDVVVNGLDQEAESHPEDSCIITMIVEKVEENNAWIQDQASAIAIIAVVKLLNI